jgi:SPP1 gp7 family putative phage head morphogenesis protein
LKEKYGDSEDFVFNKEIEKRVREDLTPEKMVEKVLNEYNPVTGYLYDREAKRKEARLTEGMMAGKENDDRDFYRKTIETNTNLWYTQSKQYAEDIADNTVIEVWKEVGVKKIMWVTQEDERVCNECRPLDRKIFDIDKVPAKPHYRCRCLKVPVIVKEKVLTPTGE